MEDDAFVSYDFNKHLDTVNKDVAKRLAYIAIML